MDRSYGSISWPARAPDLFPLDRMILTTLMYKQKIWEAVTTISEEIIASAYKEFRKRLEKCVLITWRSTN